MSTYLLATRESVKQALDIAETARADDLIDDALAAGTAAVEGLCHRTFRPVVATRYFDWPSRERGTRPWRIWLDQHDLISLTSLVAGATTLTSGQYYLEPANTGPPYTQIQINLDSTASFDNDGTWQRAIVAVGLWGHSNTERTAGALAEALDSSETAVDVTNGAVIGVGDVIRVDDERMTVTGRTWLDTAQNLGADLTASVADRTVTVSDGTAYAAGELLQIDAETLKVESITGNDLTCRRQVEGSVLAAHSTGADIYASRTLTVTRGALGTTAASHLTGTGIAAHVVPALAGRLCRAEAMVELGLAQARYALTAGAGEAAQDVSGGGIERLRAACVRQLGRKARFRSV